MGIIKKSSLFVLMAGLLLVMLPEEAETKKRKRCKNGSSIGDPHLFTFDGLAYDFQSVGEFTLVKSKDKKFEVQVRQTAVKGEHVAVNEAIGVKVGKDKVSFTNKVLRVNGKKAKFKKGKVNLRNGRVVRKGNSNYLVATTRGERVKFRTGSMINIEVQVCEKKRGYRGLLGNINGDRNDDIRTRDNKKIPMNHNFYKAVHNRVADSWRIKQENSLLHYARGETTATFTNRKFPKKLPSGKLKGDNYLVTAMVAIDTKSIPPQVAMGICQQLGVPKKFVQACAFDVAVTGNKNFAKEIAAFAGISIGDLLKLANLKKTIKKAKKAAKDIKKKKNFIEKLFD